MTRWQREVLGAIAAGEVTMVYPVASKAFADWHRPDAKPRHRRPTHTVDQLLAAGHARLTRTGQVRPTPAGVRALAAT